MSSQRLVVGLIGEPCSGKSTLRRFFEEFGAVTVDADEIVRGLYEDPAVKDEVVQLLGADVLQPDGSVDRRRVAAKVFGNRELLDRLTKQIIWPRTGKVLAGLIESFRKGEGRGILLLDAPTLVESGRAGWVDRLVWVEAPWPRRVRWAAARGWDEEELRRREAAMLPAQHKRSLAHFVVVNDGSLDDLRRQASRLWHALTGNSSLSATPESL